MLPFANLKCERRDGKFCEASLEDLSDHVYNWCVTPMKCSPWVRAFPLMVSVPQAAFVFGIVAYFRNRFLFRDVKHLRALSSKQRLFK